MNGSCDSAQPISSVSRAAAPHSSKYSTATNQPRQPQVVAVADNSDDLLRCDDCEQWRSRRDRTCPDLTHTGG
jgi:hypothetical protein